MGGPGSTRWRLHTPANTVDDCLALDANRLMRLGVLKAGVLQTGKLSWRIDGMKECSIGYKACTLDGVPWLRLHYTLTGTRERVEYRLDLTTTSPGFGGQRWWFNCPGIKPGRPCGRRVGKLYLPPGRQFFGCRHCHQLTYTSPFVA